MQQTKTKKKEKAKLKVVYSNSELVKTLKKYFKRHIGKKNAVTREQIYRAIFGDISNYSALQVYFNWDCIKKALHYLRKKTFCFVINYKTASRQYFYYVAKTWADYMVYRNNIDELVKNMKKLVRRCQVAVEEEYWKKL